MISSYRLRGSLLLALLALSYAPAAAGQSPQAAGQAVLKAGTPVALATAVPISTKTHKQGDRFDLSVSRDVLVDGQVAIPRGEPALAEVMRHVPKGPYGQAGKLEIRLLYVTLGDRRVRLDGEAERAGASAAVPAVTASVVVSGIVGALIFGKNGSIPAGAPITGYVHRDLPLTILKRQ